MTGGLSALLLFWTMCVCLWGFVLANCPRVEVQPVLITVNRVHRVLASACVCGFNERWNLLTEAFSFNKKKKEKGKLSYRHLKWSRVTLMR